MRRTNLKKYLILPLSLILTFSLATGQPQKNDDRKIAKLRKDIHAAESTLIKTMYHRSTKDAVGLRGSVQSVYFPDIGIAFRMRSVSHKLQNIRDALGRNDGRDHVPDSFEGAGAKQAPAEFKQNVLAFFNKNIKVLEHLEDNERIIISKERPAPAFRFAGNGFRYAGRDAAVAGAFSVSARKGDIILLQEQKISKDEFGERIRWHNAANLDPAAKEYTQFSTRFEKSLKNVRQGRFSVFGSISNVIVDEFGALLLFDATKTTSWDDGTFYVKIDQFRRRNEFEIARLRRLNAQIDNRKAGTQGSAELESWTSVYIDSTEILKTMQAYDEFEKNISEYLIDYGKSVRVLGPKQRITLAVKIRGENPGIPRRVVFEINKRDLDAFNAEQLSRENLLKKVAIRKFNN